MLSSDPPRRPLRPSYSALSATRTAYPAHPSTAPCRKGSDPFHQQQDEAGGGWVTACRDRSRSAGGAAGTGAGQCCRRLGAGMARSEPPLAARGMQDPSTGSARPKAMPLEQGTQILATPSSLGSSGRPSRSARGRGRANRSPGAPHQKKAARGGGHGAGEAAESLHFVEIAAGFFGLLLSSSFCSPVGFG